MVAEAMQRDAGLNGNWTDVMNVLTEFRDSDSSGGDDDAAAVAPTAVTTAAASADDTRATTRAYLSEHNVKVSTITFV
jgi:hypothetical protein